MLPQLKILKIDLNAGRYMDFRLEDIKEVQSEVIANGLNKFPNLVVEDFEKVSSPFAHVSTDCSLKCAWGWYRIINICCHQKRKWTGLGRDVFICVI